jgi:UDP-glucose 4-epimerase
MKVLVTGGAGYIGAVTVKRLQKEGFEPVIFDNLYMGHKESVTCPLIVGNLEDKEALFQLLDEHQFDGVIHFAAYALAGESMEDPYKYFNGNILGGLNLLEYMREKEIKHIIFSSTCAIYGKPEVLPVSEQESKKPESVYGESKLQFEKVLSWYDQIFGIKNICLRYFNAAGAALDGSLGEEHAPETHIIPIAIKAAQGQLSEFTLYGDDYDTKDGTCVRDYIHVEDLASAHILALKKLQESNTSDNFNLGTGVGYTNKEVIETIKKVSGVDFPVVVKEKRAGDPAAVFADNKKAKEILGWNPEHSDLETIVSSAWKWHSKSYKVES